MNNYQLRELLLLFTTSRTPLPKLYFDVYGGEHCVRIGRGFPGELTEQTANYRKCAADRFWSFGEFPQGTAVEREHRIFGPGSNPA